MKIMKWLKKEFMKTPGYMRVNLSLLTILAISSVSSTALLISSLVNDTSVENISNKNVSLEVVRDGLRLRVTGKDTMEALTSLVQIESYLETQRSNERSYPYIPDSEM